MVSEGNTVDPDVSLNKAYDTAARLRDLESNKNHRYRSARGCYGAPVVLEWATDVNLG